MDFDDRDGGAKPNVRYWGILQVRFFPPQFTLSRGSIAVEPALARTERMD
jgi:hypothetical protein